MSWEHGERKVRFLNRVQEIKDSQLAEVASHCAPQYFPIEVCSAFDESLVAAWVTFEHHPKKGKRGKDNKFLYRLWRIQYGDEEPFTIWGEVIAKEIPNQGAISMSDLACDIDRLIIEKNHVWMRDLRCIQDPCNLPYPQYWTKVEHY